jgi:hypothetical protein
MRWRQRLLLLSWTSECWRFSGAFFRSILGECLIMKTRLLKPGYVQNIIQHKEGQQCAAMSRYLMIEQTTCSGRGAP